MPVAAWLAGREPRPTTARRVWKRILGVSLVILSLFANGTEQGRRWSALYFNLTEDSRKPLATHRLDLNALLPSIMSPLTRIVEKPEPGHTMGSYQRLCPTAQLFGERSHQPWCGLGTACNRLFTKNTPGDTPPRSSESYLLEVGAPGLAMVRRSSSLSGARIVLCCRVDNRRLTFEVPRPGPWVGQLPSSKAQAAASSPGIEEARE